MHSIATTTTRKQVKVAPTAQYRYNDDKKAGDGSTHSTVANNYD